MYRPLPLILFLTLLGSSLYAQFQPETFLSLQNVDRMKRHRFFVGDTLGLELKSDNIRIFGLLSKITSDSIYLSGIPLGINQVDKVLKIPSRASRYWLGMLKWNMRLAAGITTVMMAINLPQVKASPRSYIGAGVAVIGLTALSFLLDLARYRKYKLGKHWELKMMDTRF